MQIQQKKVEELIPYVNNSRTHSDEQVAQIAASIKEFGFNNPILLDKDKGIIAGHGRLMAARKLGMEEVPTIELGHLTRTQKKSYIIADNKLALNAGWDNELLTIELNDLLADGFDIDLLGFSAKELLEYMENKDSEYSKKIETPVYEPKGEKPQIVELVNSIKSNDLIQKIMKSNVSSEEKDFLIKAAYRHNVFNYAQIAEYYCHVSEEMQELMEDSALIIIDYDKAIEQGYVQMSKGLEDLFAETYAE